MGLDMKIFCQITRQFVSGLRLAASRKENVEFH